MDSPAHTLRGGCHCGNLSVLFASRTAPEELRPRACGCSFCRKHGARSVSDPRGRARLGAEDADGLIRYRFGLRSADFWICGRCGIYVGAVATIEGRDYAVLNANALDDAKRFVQEPEPRSYEGESADERAARRRRLWTPVAALEGVG